MKPIELRIKRFGSVLEEQVFVFPETPGLYFLSGKNGSGKSTVWKALTWCLFGKDAKGLKAGDVANWSMPEGASVEFAFEVNEPAWMRYVVERTHAPNSWKFYNVMDGMPREQVVDLAKDETNELYSMLQLDFTTWLHTVLLAQDEPMFLDLKPNDKAALFAEVMRLDKWQEFSDKASKKASAQDMMNRGLEIEVANLRGKLEGMTAAAADLPRRIAEWNNAHKMQRLAITAQYEAKMREQAPIDEALRVAEASAESSRTTLRAIRSLVEDLGTDYDVLNADLIKAVRVDAGFGNEYSRLGDLIDRLDDLDECPTCGKPDVGRGPAMARAKRERDAAAIELDKSEEVVKSIETRILEHKEALTEAENRAKKALARVDLAEGSLKDARTKQEALSRDLDRLEEQADKLDNEVNPHEQELDRQRTDAEHVQRRLHTLDRAVASESMRYEMLGFWVRGFKDIRLVLIAEALDQLALEVSGCLSQLGLVGWELTFEVDRETKSGTIARGFNVFVKGPANERQVPWEAWSGGEAQRLRIAAQMGLANLIRSSTGASIALEVWDEPSHGMEAQGIDDLLQALARRAQEEQRVIWVTDHHALGSGAFAGTVMVSKDNGGTHYEVMQ